MKSLGGRRQAASALHGTIIIWLELERAYHYTITHYLLRYYLPLYPLPLQYLQLSFDEILLHLPTTSTSSSTHLLLFCTTTTATVDTSGRTLFLITNSPTFDHESERSKTSAILYYHCDRGVFALLLPHALRLSCPERAPCVVLPYFSLAARTSFFRNKM